MLKKLLLTATVAASLTFPALAETPKPHLRFAFVGCNRVGFTEQTPDNPSTANRQQFLQSCADLNVQPPAYFFFIGDMVTNYAPGGEVLREQLQAWIDLYETTDLAKSKTVLVPVVGNHEVLKSTQDPVTKVWTDFPNPDTLPVWNQVLERYLRWNDGPTTKGDNPDGLTQDQDRLSFTVREGDVLFLCINTDTFIDDKTIGDVPLVWIADKLKEAEADDSIRHIFLLGHKPVTRPGVPGSMIRDGEEVQLDKMMAESGKFRAFLTAHFHLWDCRRTESGVLQVIAGNSGTNPSSPFGPDGKGYFGHTVVELNDDGSLVIENWGRPIPTPYDSNEPQPPATLIERIPVPARAH